MSAVPFDAQIRPIPKSSNSGHRKSPQGDTLARERPPVLLELTPGALACEETESMLGCIYPQLAIKSGFTAFEGYCHFSYGYYFESS